MPKPFFRKQTRSWYLQLNGRQIPLGKDKDAAFQRYHEIMAARPEPGGPAVSVINAFLEYTSKNFKRSTYDFYRLHLRRFARSIGPRLRIANVKPKHVHDWVKQDFAGQSDTSRHNAYRSVGRVLSWAVENELLDKVPKIKKPTPQSRQGFATQADFDDLLAKAAPELRDYLELAWRTGARPQELREATAGNLVGGCLVFEQGKGGRPRLIVLDDICKAIVERLAAAHPEGPLLRNSKGRPWTRNALAARFRRLGKVTPYQLRHGFASRAVASDVDSLVVAKLMGHKSLTMLNKVYYHEDPDHLATVLSGLNSAIQGPPAAPEHNGPS